MDNDPRLEEYERVYNGSTACAVNHAPSPVGVVRHAIGEDHGGPGMESYARHRPEHGPITRRPISLLGLANWQTRIKRESGLAFPVVLLVDALQHAGRAGTRQPARCCGAPPSSRAHGGLAAGALAAAAATGAATAGASARCGEDDGGGGDDTRVVNWSGTHGAAACVHTPETVGEVEALLARRRDDAAAAERLGTPPNGLSFADAAACSRSRCSTGSCASTRPRAK